MGRIAKIAGWAALFAAYVWIAGVRNADRVTRRKRSRARLDSPD